MPPSNFVDAGAKVFVHCSGDIEKAKKIQKEIVKILGLSENEAFHLYDLAAKTKKHRTLPVDICEYIASDENIKLFLRNEKERNISGVELLELL